MKSVQFNNSRQVIFFDRNDRDVIKVESHPLHCFIVIPSHEQKYVPKHLRAKVTCNEITVMAQPPKIDSNSSIALFTEALRNIVTLCVSDAAAQNKS